MFCFDSSPDSVRPTFAFTEVWCVDGPYLLFLAAVRTPEAACALGEVQN